MREGGGIENTRCIPRMTSFESNGLLPRTIRDQQAGLSSRRPLNGVDHPYLWIIPFPHPLCLEASVRGSIFRVGIRGLNNLCSIQSGNETCLRMTMLQKAMQSGFLQNPPIDPTEKVESHLHQSILQQNQCIPGCNTFETFAVLTT